MKFIKPVTITDAKFVSSTVAETDAAAWSATTHYTLGQQVMLTTGVHKIYEAAQGRNAAVTITIAPPGVVTWTAHALADDTPIVFTTTGALPTGLTAGTTYYASTVTQDTFNVRATPGGALITTTGSQSGTHTCGLAAGYNKTPDENPDSWIEVGPTNRWAMFDTAVGSKTSGATPLTAVVDPGIVNSLALLDLEGTSVDISMTDGALGPTVFSRSVTLGDAAEILDWYDYFFADIEPRTSVIITDLPAYSAGRLTVTVNAATTAKCGTLAVGALVTLGNTLASPVISIQDFSKKETDDFGLTSVVERSYAKRIEARFWLPMKRVDYAAVKLAAVRAVPVVWIADNVLDSLLAYGFFRDWGIDVSYPDYCEAAITIEGMT